MTQQFTGEPFLGAALDPDPKKKRQQTKKERQKLDRQMTTQMKHDKPQ